MTPLWQDGTFWLAAEKRYVWSKVVWLTPVFAAILSYCAVIKSPWTILIGIKYAIILVLCHRFSAGNWSREEAMIRDGYRTKQKIVNSVVLEATLVVVSGLVVGTVAALIKHTIVGIVLGLALATLLGLGVVLRLLLYEIWLARSVRIS